MVQNPRSTSSILFNSKPQQKVRKHTSTSSCFLLRLWKSSHFERQTISNSLGNSRPRLWAHNCRLDVWPPCTWDVIFAGWPKGCHVHKKHHPKWQWKTERFPFCFNLLDLVAYWLRPSSPDILPGGELQQPAERRKEFPIWGSHQQLCGVFGHSLGQSVSSVSLGQEQTAHWRAQRSRLDWSSHCPIRPSCWPRIRLAQWQGLTTNQGSQWLISAWGLLQKTIAIIFKMDQEQNDQNNRWASQTKSKSWFALMQLINSCAQHIGCCISHRHPTAQNPDHKPGDISRATASDLTNW